MPYRPFRKLLVLALRPRDEAREPCRAAGFGDDYALSAILLCGILSAGGAAGWAGFVLGGEESMGGEWCGGCGRGDGECPRRSGTELDARGTKRRRAMGEML
jgi:hypothetical protein